LENNIAAVRRLVRSAADATSRPARPGIEIIGPVSSKLIIDFLAEYKFHENSRDLDSRLLSRYIEARRDEGELMHFKIAIMSRSAGSSYLGDVDLGLPMRSGCINRARMQSVGGTTYADIKTLMSRNDRVIDLEIPQSELSADVTNADMARMRNLPSKGGRGDDSGLLLVYPVSKDSKPVRGTARTRMDLKAASHVIGVGLVFPESSSKTAKVDYVTADVSGMKVEVEAPDEMDEPDDSDADRGPE
jgi:hypothetical protein